MDISSDNSMLVTGSADKNIKLWGLDFGDCHKSIFAHSDTITQVQFSPNTHYFFSASKDHVLKYWDGDTFEQIQKLNGHHGEIWALCVGKSGDLVVTAGNDKSIRVWEKTEEPLFLEEERERDLEERNDTEMLDSANRDGDDDEVGTAGIRTIDSLKSSERIIEAIELADIEREKWNDYEDVNIFSFSNNEN